MTELRPIKHRWKSRLLLGSWLKSLLKRLHSLHCSSFLLAQYGCGGWIAATMLGHKAHATCLQPWDNKTGAWVLGVLASWNCFPTLDFFFFFYMFRLPAIHSQNLIPICKLSKFWKGPQGKEPFQVGLSPVLFLILNSFKQFLQIDLRSHFNSKAGGAEQPPFRWEHPQVRCRLSLELCGL